MTDNERLDHAIVVFTLLNEKLLADLCKATKKYQIQFRIKNDYIYIDNGRRHLIEIIQKCTDRTKADKVFFEWNGDDTFEREISFKLTHNPE